MKELLLFMTRRIPQKLLMHPVWGGRRIVTRENTIISLATKQCFVNYQGLKLMFIITAKEKTH